MGRPVDPHARLHRCEGSTGAKERAEVILDYLAGRKTAEEASREVGVSVSRFQQLVEQSCQGLVSSIEPKPAGRPRKETEIDERVQSLESQLSELQEQLRIAKLLGEAPWLPRRRQPPREPGR